MDLNELAEDNDRAEGCPEKRHERVNNKNLSDSVDLKTS